MSPSLAPKKTAWISRFRAYPCGSLYAKNRFDVYLLFIVNIKDIISLKKAGRIRGRYGLLSLVGINRFHLRVGYSAFRHFGLALYLCSES